MEPILVLIFLAIVVAAVCGKGPAEPPIYQIQVVPPEQPAGRGHLLTAVVLVVIMLLMLASG